MSNNSNAQSGGTSIAGLLGIAFIVLKLTHVISWPWLWVLSPFWIPLGIFVVFFVVAVLVSVILSARS